MTWTESVKISHSNGPPILEFDLSSERLPSQHPVHVVFATKFLATILESISCNKIPEYVLDNRNSKIMTLKKKNRWCLKRGTRVLRQTYVMLKEFSIYDIYFDCTFLFDTSTCISVLYCLPSKVSTIVILSWSTLHTVLYITFSVKSQSL